jgi:hypothetical protein
MQLLRSVRGGRFGRVAPKVSAKPDEVAVKAKPAAGHVHVEPTTKPKWFN